MKKLQQEQESLAPIKGFKVMKWLRKVRNERYKLYKENPEAYFKRIKNCDENIKKRLHSR